MTAVSDRNTNVCLSWNPIMQLSDVTIVSKKDFYRIALHRISHLKKD